MREIGGLLVVHCGIKRMKDDPARPAACGREEVQQTRKKHKEKRDSWRIEREGLDSEGEAKILKFM